jgi:hypothetical protein
MLLMSLSRRTDEITMIDGLPFQVFGFVPAVSKMLGTFFVCLDVRTDDASRIPDSDGPIQPTMPLGPEPSDSHGSF